MMTRGIVRKDCLRCIYSGYCDPSDNSFPDCRDYIPRLAEEEDKDGE